MPMLYLKVTNMYIVLWIFEFCIVIFSSVYIKWIEWGNLKKDLKNSTLLEKVSKEFEVGT